MHNILRSRPRAIATSSTAGVDTSADDEPAGEELAITQPGDNAAGPDSNGQYTVILEPVPTAETRRSPNSVDSGYTLEMQAFASEDSKPGATEQIVDRVSPTNPGRASVSEDFFTSIATERIVDQVLHRTCETEESVKVAGPESSGAPQKIAPAKRKCTPLKRKASSLRHRTPTKRKATPEKDQGLKKPRRGNGRAEGLEALFSGFKDQLEEDSIRLNKTIMDATNGLVQVLARSSKSAPE